MKSSRHRRHLLAVVAITATVGLGAGVLPQFAAATPHPRNLDTVLPDTTPPASLPVGPAPAACVLAATTVTCPLYARAGTVDAGLDAGIPIWGFTTDPVGAGLLGGDAANTIIINEGQTLDLALYNQLPAGAGRLSLEVPAAQGLPDLTGVDVGFDNSATPYAVGPLAAGTYVYQAGATPEQPRQLAMGLSAIIIVRPAVYDDAARTAYTPPVDAADPALAAVHFDDEALVVMNEIDPAFNLNPLTSDVEDYTPHYFFINGKAYPSTDDIAAKAGDNVLLRVANLGIRDRALGLVNSRLTMVGDDSYRLDNQIELESKLLTPGQVADLTTLVDPGAPLGSQFPLLDLSRHLNNNAEAGLGGMLTFIDVVAEDVPTVPVPAAHIDAFGPATNDGTQPISVTFTISGTADTARWYLDDVGSTCTGAAPWAVAGPGPYTDATLLAQITGNPACVTGVDAPWKTGAHVLWVQPFDGATPGIASGDVFTLGLVGPTIFALSTDPHFANLSLNKVDANPPGSTDVILTGSAEPSLLDRTIDMAQGCLTLVAADAECTAADGQVAVDVAAAVGPSHAQGLTARIPVADFVTYGSNTVYVRAHEVNGLMERWSTWSASASVSVVIDTDGPAITAYQVNDASDPDTSPIGIGNYPGNLNFLESARISVTINDNASPIADAELFVGDTVEPDASMFGSGSQLRPRAGQWLDDLTATSRDAYVEIPVSELQSYPQGSIPVYVHAKDAAGNWGPMFTSHVLLDKTNPEITAYQDNDSHVYTGPDEVGNMVLTGGNIEVHANDPATGVSQLTIPSDATKVQIRYHVSAVTGTIGTVGAGIFYQTAQQALGTVTASGGGDFTINFDWHLVAQPPLPPEATTSVWVWVLDAAGNPSVPVEVLVGPPVQP